MNVENTTPNTGVLGTQDNPPCAPSDSDSGLCGYLPLAMAYVPKQYWRKLYDQDRAMKAGTLFEELDLPFLGVKMGDHDE